MRGKEIIKKKFQELNQYLKELRRLRSISWDEFNSSLSKQWMICYGLQLSIQIIIDVGNHILATIGESQIMGIGSWHNCPLILSEAPSFITIQ